MKDFTMPRKCLPLKNLKRNKSKIISNNKDQTWRASILIKQAALKNQFSTWKY